MSLIEKFMEIAMSEYDSSKFTVCGISIPYGTIVEPLFIVTGGGGGGGDEVPT